MSRRTTAPAARACLRRAFSDPSIALGIGERRGMIAARRRVLRYGDVTRAVVDQAEAMPNMWGDGVCVGVDDDLQLVREGLDAPAGRCERRAARRDRAMP